MKVLFVAVAFTLIFYSFWGTYFWIDKNDYEQHIKSQPMFWSDPVKNIGNFLYPMWIYLFYPDIEIFMTVYLCLVIPILLFYYVKKSIGKSYPIWISALYFWSGFPFYFLRSGFLKTTIFIMAMLIALIIYNSLKGRKQIWFLLVCIPIAFLIQYPAFIYNSLTFVHNNVYVNINNSGLKGLFLLPFVLPFIKDKKILFLATLMYVIGFYSNRIFSVIYIIIFPYIFIPLGKAYIIIKDNIPKPLSNVVARTTTFIKENGFTKKHGN